MEKKFTDLGDRKRWWRNLTNIRTERRVRTQQEKFSREKFLRLNTDFHRHCWCGAEDFTGGEHWRGRKATEDGNLRGKIKWGEVGWAGICKAKDLLAWTLHRHIEVERSFPHQKAACCLSLSLLFQCAIWTWHFGASTFLSLLSFGQTFLCFSFWVWSRPK